MSDLLLELDPTLGRRAGLEDALRRAVLSGRLTAGTALPSSRALATELGVARATVVGAYEQLVAEGYLAARQGAATVVADVHASAPPTERRPGSGRSFRAALYAGEPDRASFPRAAWLASARAALTTSPDALFGYGDQRGVPELRAALAAYLNRSRAVVTDPDRIVVFGGYTSALAVLAIALRGLGAARVAMEDPGLPHHRGIMRDAGLDVVAAPVDADGIVVDGLDADAVITTPSHQYPLGVVLAPARRAALLDWARRRDAWILEDDYDGEFRYDRQPLGALQGLDPERVIYGGTASKSLAAGIRLGWLALPTALVEPVVRARFWRNDVSNLDQATLADFITSGRLDRHVRRMRAVYRARRDDLVDVLSSTAPQLDLVGVAAGLHVTAIGPDEDALVAGAHERGIGLQSLGQHRFTPGSGPGGLVIGYSRPAAHEFASALGLLRDYLIEVNATSATRVRRDRRRGGGSG